MSVGRLTLSTVSSLQDTIIMSRIRFLEDFHVKFQVKVGISPFTEHYSMHVGQPRWSSCTAHVDALHISGGAPPAFWRAHPRRQVIMQRRGAGWAPDFVFPETSFRPMVSGGATGGTRNAAALAEALASGTRIPPFDDSAAANPHRQQLAGIVSLLLDRHALAHPLPMMSTRENPEPRWRRPHPVHEALWQFHDSLKDVFVTAQTTYSFNSCFNESETNELLMQSRVLKRNRMEATDRAPRSSVGYSGAIRGTTVLV